MEKPRQGKEKSIEQNQAPLMRKVTCQTSRTVINHSVHQTAQEIIKLYHSRDESSNSYRTVHFHCHIDVLIVDISCTVFK